ncbi:amidohydrolase family protein [Nocardiopsis potens]|uniref:amidohydrolase family protein n=1 Tax=Nocardiopsis potens TaxID=1246458 RepID=UPI00034BC5CC|nr:amidohydrolase family protein [Nocardiopsis potens]
MGHPSSPVPPVPEPAPGSASPGALSRRGLFAQGGRAAVAGGAAWLMSPAQQAAAAAAPAEEGGAPKATVTQGTNISAAPSPDGKWIAFDLYTAIWLVPAGGGKARRLTGDLADATRPRFSPDSERIAFQAYAEGNYHVYVLDLPDGKPRRLTSGPHDHREPAFSPDGTRIALASDRGDGYGIWLYDLESEELTAVTDTGADEAEPAWTPDGERIVHVSDRSSVRSTDLKGRTEELVPAAEHTTLYSPAPGPGGRLAHIAAHADTVRLIVDGEPASGDDEDVFVGTVTWTGDNRLLYTADGAIRSRAPGGGAEDVAFSATVPYLRREPRRARRDIDDTGEHPVRGIAGPVLSPDGRSVAFRALGALWVMRIGKKPEAVVDDGSFSSDPDWHPDGASLVYSSDREGSPALWRHDLESGTDERITRLDGAQVFPRWSPDGRRIAYQDQDGATWVYDTGSGTARRVLPELFQPGRPTWSPDGRTLALAAVRPRSRRFREGSSQILTVDLETGKTSYTEPAPHRSLSTRGDDGPVWSPDGRHLAFVMESLLWVVPVDGRGAFTGEPRRLTSEPTDAPSWSGDSASLLYLGNGRLRRVRLEGGRPETVRMPLTWRRRPPSGRVVVQAGALWDGRSDGLRRNVDIVIDGNRITAVEKRRERTEEEGTTLVDATGLTVIPGLIDAHNHWHLRGREWGSRQGPLWLSYGVTTTRSPGDPAYQMLETREALDSGAITGPRYLATGEAVDGSRIYYDFMRTTYDAEGVERELERAFELDYDLVKTYVRLPVRSQRTAVDRAHAVDLPLTSHYLYPAVHLGMDGMEHTGATNRLGYSQTVSLLGRSYEDAVTLFAKSGMALTPTLFTSAALYAEDRSLVEDERTEVLFPAWEYRSLVDKADEAGSDAPDARRTRAALPGHVAMVRAVHEGGGTVLGGTDAPLDNVAISLHQNMRALVKYGFTPRAALTVTTSTTAEWLGLGEHLGTVEPGRLADLAAVEGDPLDDITAAANVRITVVDGTVHTREDLLEPFRERTRLRSSEEPTALGDPLPSATADGPWWHGESERTAPHRC